MKKDIERPKKGLLIRQPYASMVVRGEMPLKWMGKSTQYRGKVCICSTLTPATEEGADDDKFPKGVALGTVEIVDVVKSGDKWMWETRNPHEFKKPKKFKKKRARLWINLEFENE